MAKVPVELMDAADLLSEAVDLIEAAFMACLDVPDKQRRDALRGITCKAGDIARLSSEKLQSEIERLREEVNG